MNALTRREVLAAGAAGAAALALPGRPGLASALAAPKRCGRLEDIEHVVIFVQENRSFDHYFGHYRGVRGFADGDVPPLRDGSGLNVFHQPGYKAKGHHGHLVPFRLNTVNTSKNGECTHDITHDWGPQHRAWNGGRMDHFLREHLAAEGDADGPLTMGYYRREDLPYYYALADAFTLCDHYHCSVMGPTDPNQLYLVSGTLDPRGKHGGPMLVTTPNRLPQFSWTTMPEQLQARGISWKAYLALDNFAPTADAPLSLFEQYFSNAQLAANAFGNTFPTQFETDVANGSLPSVSWIWGSIVTSEHPPAPVEFGAYTTDSILSTLTSNPDLWKKTALFVTWDENGGFFDHVPPPVPPPGTKGEFLTVDPLPADAEGVRGPIGLGFRVPMLIVSPFARGGFVSPQVFDHTSILRFLETRFGAEVPHLSDWRRSVTGDLTGAFNFASPDRSIPALPTTSLTSQSVLGSACPTDLAGLAGFPTPPYPVPLNALPGQEPGAPRRPSGPC
jgi:phospholipase C